MTETGIRATGVRRIMHMVWVVVSMAALVYVGLVLLLFLLQERYIFPATQNVYRDPGAFGRRFDEIFLDVNGASTHSWYIYAEHPRGTVLFSHGNAGNIADRLESCENLLKFGFDVLVYDYGGYGLSSGRPSEQRCYEDARAAWKYLTEERGIPSNRIVLFGRSLGTGPTAQLATETNPAAVILESPMYSMPRLAQETFPFFPAKWLVRHYFDNAAKVPLIKSPLMIIHSADDEIVPYQHGVDLFDRAVAPKTFLRIHGGHNDGFILSGDERDAALRAFLEPLVPAESP